MITLNIKGKMIKLLEENSGENLYDLELGKECLKTTSLSWSIKGKLWTSSLFKTSLIQKTCYRMNRKATNWETIFTGHTSRIYKKFSRLSSKKTNTPVRKRATALNGHFTIDDTWIENTYMKNIRVYNLWYSVHVWTCLN